jgi:hypothetical protein
VATEPAYGSRSGEGRLAFVDITIIVLGTLNMVWGMAAIEAYAFWALVIVGIDVLVITDSRRTATGSTAGAHRPEPYSGVTFRSPGGICA